MDEAQPRAASPPARVEWADPSFWAIVAAAAGLRVALLFRYPDLVARADESLHLIAGVLVAHFGAEAVGHWPPGYEFFLAGIFRLAGADPVAAKLATVLVSTLTVVLVYLLAKALGGVRAARIAGILCAFEPSLVAYSHYLFSETLFAALLTGGAWLAFRRPQGASYLEQGGAGLCFGLAILTRSVPLYFLLFWVGWEAARRRWPEARRAALITAVALLVVAPWTLRNFARYDAFVPVDATATMTAHLAFQPGVFNRDLGFPQDQTPERPPCPRPPLARPPLLPEPSALRALFPPRALAVVEFGDLGFMVKLRQLLDWLRVDWPKAQRCERSRAIAFLREHPGTVAGNALRRVYAFWGPNSFLLRAVYLGDYHQPPLDRGHYGAVKAAVVLFHLLVVGCALLVLGRRDAPALVPWVALLAGFSTAIHALAVASSRYRLPLLPLLVVLAALWLARPGLPEGRRALPVGAALLLFLALSLHYTWATLP